jgi:glutamate 5-kinase
MSHFQFPASKANHPSITGTSSIVDEKTHEPLLSILSTIVETACKLQKDGHRVVIVSSGAIGVALGHMALERRPKHLPQVQALAAIGQCKLMSLWDQLFMHRRQAIAQILLTRNDIADRTQYLNAQNTFIELLHMRVIPIVNENDTLSVAEIRFGDNDTLSAITAAMVQADYLFLMTDVDCLYDSNPRTNPNAKSIEIVQDIGDLVADVSSAGSSVGTGGMATKITAARLATSAGVTTIITRSDKPGNIASIVAYAESKKAQELAAKRNSQPGSTDGSESLSNSMSDLTVEEDSSLLNKAVANDISEMNSGNTCSKVDATTLPPLHTRFIPDLHPIRDRYFWLLYGLAPHGTVYVDKGAHRALADKAGLLPAGVVDVDGHFAQQEAVRIVVVQRKSKGSSEYEKVDPAPFEVGRALVNYSAAEIKRIRGLKSTEIHAALGYADSEYIALRENIAFGNRQSRPSTPNRMSMSHEAEQRR